MLRSTRFCASSAARVGSFPNIRSKIARGFASIGIGVSASFHENVFR